MPVPLLTCLRLMLESILLGILAIHARGDYVDTAPRPGAPPPTCHPSRTMPPGLPAIGRPTREAVRVPLWYVRAPWPTAFDASERDRRERPASYFYAHPISNGSSDANSQLPFEKEVVNL